jgi:hypothetical protein
MEEAISTGGKYMTISERFVGCSGKEKQTQGQRIIASIMFWTQNLPKNIYSRHDLKKVKEGAELWPFLCLYFRD